MKPIIVIPSRLAATRLPGKPLADIHGEPMIVHVWRRACETDLGPVLVATDSVEVVEAVKASGGEAVLTVLDHASGSDRIHEALCRVDADKRYDLVINLQGDLPTVEPSTVRAASELLNDAEVMIGTPVAPIMRDDEKAAASVVKMVGSPIAEDRFRVLYFTRATAPWGDGPLYHHIGLYAWRRTALDAFVALPPSSLERREKLEQLRALENGIRIDAVVVGEVPLGVDTPHDLERARQMIGDRTLKGI
jgi:3-deoxy-manno-octulosonate cytidylyltransferase (CMP-KDO synthetase)